MQKQTKKEFGCIFFIPLQPSRRAVSKADSAGMLLSQEREAWTREKLQLEKALHLSQSQVARLRAEIRSDSLREVTGPEADNSALKVSKNEAGGMADQVFISIFVTHLLLC